MPKTAAADRKPGPGRPPHQRHERIAKRIETWVAVGVKINDIAELEALLPPTLRRCYMAELKFSAIRANATVAMRIYEASRTDWRAGAFWLGRRGGPEWAREAPRVEYVGSKQAAEQQSEDAHVGTHWDGLLDISTVDEGRLQ